MRPDSKFVGLWLRTSGHAEVVKLALAETNGNISAMVRKLMAEALVTRSEKKS